MTPIEEVPEYDAEAVEEMLSEADDFSHPWKGDPEKDPFKRYAPTTGSGPPASPSSDERNERYGTRLDIDVITVIIKS